MLMCHDRYEGYDMCQKSVDKHFHDPASGLDDVYRIPS